MSIRGEVKNVAILPIGNKNVDPIETVVPAQIDVRNGFISDLGNWSKRPGYVEYKNLGVDEPISLLIPIDNGYAVSLIGKVFKNVLIAPIEMTGAIVGGSSRPTFAVHDNTIVLCGGNIPIKIVNGVVSTLGGSPPNAKFVDRISSYTIMSGGFSDTKWNWSASNNPENWTTGNSGSADVKLDGQRIMNMKVFKEVIYFFKEKSIEVWILLGAAAAPFVRQEGAWIGKGLGAEDSLITANDKLMWFGHDGDFYELEGIQPKVIPGSASYRKRIDSLQRPEKIVGFDFRKEGKVRWFAPIDGVCFVYDYKYGTFSEDNTWDHGQWERLPINSYIEMNNKQYFGSYDYDGKIYEWSHDYKDDDGKPIRVYRKLRIIPSEKGNKVRFNRMGLRFKPGVATSGVTNPIMFYRYRFDGKLWYGYFQPSLGVVGTTNPWKHKAPLGVGREMEIEIIETDAVDFILTHMNLTVRELGK